MDSPEQFQRDIVVHIPIDGIKGEIKASAEGKWLVSNIEVDGMHHQEKKIKFSKLRDAYLKSRGVAVRRIDASCLKKMDDNQLELWLLDAVAKSLLLSTCHELIDSRQRWVDECRAHGSACNDTLLSLCSSLCDS